MKHLFRRILTAGLAAVILLAGCPGCSVTTVPQTNDSLTIAYYEGYYVPLNIAVRRFQNAYPDVEVTLQKISLSEEDGDLNFSQMTTEIMAGKGPDILLMSPFYTYRYMKSSGMDLYKMMDSGAFLDLREWMEADPDAWADCHPKVLEGARHQGHQYLIPLSYTMPSLLARKSVLDESGFDTASCTDFLSLWAELSRYAERYHADPTLPRPLRWPSIIRDFPNFTGIPWLDYDAEKVDFTRPEWRTIFDEFIPLYATMSPEEQENGPGHLGAFTGDGADLFEGYAADTGFVRITGDARRIAETGEPVFLPIYDVNGGIQVEPYEYAGVLSNSHNQQNAYRFMKILVEPDLQKTSSYGSGNPLAIPISNQALRKALDKLSAERGEVWVYDGDDLPPLPKEFVRDYLDAVERIDGVYFLTPMRRRFYEEMIPYLRGEEAYEPIIERLQSSMEIYITE